MLKQLVYNKHILWYVDAMSAWFSYHLHVHVDRDFEKNEYIMI